MWDRAADILEAGEVPEIWKIPALLRLDSLHGTIIANQENTFAIGLLLQSQPATVVAQPCESLNEVVFVQAFECRQPRNFGVVQAHLHRHDGSRPCNVDIRGRSALAEGNERVRVPAFAAAVA